MMVHLLTLQRALPLLAIATSTLASVPMDDGYGDSIQWRRWWKFSQEWYAAHYEFPSKFSWDEEGYKDCGKQKFPYHEPHDGLLTNKFLDCHQEEECQRLEEYKAREGFEVVGWNKHVCEDNHARPIYCSKITIEKFPGNRICRWRGSGDTCRGAGKPGEVVMFKSRWGGFPAEDGESVDEQKCNHGFKYFTCPLPGFDEMMSHCRWENDCSIPVCAEDEDLLAYGPPTQSGLCMRQQWNRQTWPKLCCKKLLNGPALTKCYWADLKRPKGVSDDVKGSNQNCRTAPGFGNGYCNLNMCLPDEVTVARDPVGDRFWTSKELDYHSLHPQGCSGDGMKSLCCKTLQEDTDDRIDLPWYCRQEWAKDTEACRLPGEKGNSTEVKPVG